MSATRCLLALVFGWGALGAAETHAYEGVPEFQGATLTGMVTLRRPAPVRPPLEVNKDHQACGQTVPDETYVVGAHGGLANVVVYLEGIERGKVIGSPTVEIDHHWCRFEPHVLAFPKGSLLWVKNQDPILHTTHAFLGSNTLFHTAMPAHGGKIPKVINETGLMEFGCAAGHTWMRAWAMVTDHPYVTVTDAEGRFVMTDVPPGIHRIVAWHEAEGTRRAQVRIDRGRETEVFFDY